MVFILIFVTSLISALIFFLLPITGQTKNLAKFLHNSLTTMRSDILSDDQKQKILFSTSGKTLVISMKLTGYFLIMTLPFIIIIIIEKLFCQTVSLPEILISLKGIGITVSGFIIFFLLKKVYGNIRL